MKPPTNHHIPVTAARYEKRSETRKIWKTNQNSYNQRNEKRNPNQRSG
jgi:hypothetical protein